MFTTRFCEPAVTAISFHGDFDFFRFPLTSDERAKGSPPPNSIRDLHRLNPGVGGILFGARQPNTIVSAR